MIVYCFNYPNLSSTGVTLVALGEQCAFIEHRLNTEHQMPIYNAKKKCHQQMHSNLLSFYHFLKPTVPTFFETNSQDFVCLLRGGKWELSATDRERKQNQHECVYLLSTRCSLLNRAAVRPLWKNVTTFPALPRRQDTWLSETAFLAENMHQASGLWLRSSLLLLIAFTIFTLSVWIRGRYSLRSGGCIHCCVGACVAPVKRGQELIRCQDVNVGSQAGSPQLHWRSDCCERVLYSL